MTTANELLNQFFPLCKGEEEAISCALIAVEECLLSLVAQRQLDPTVYNRLLGVKQELKERKET